MKKSFLKIVMLLTAVVLTFSCKDYDDDIDTLQRQINAVKSEVTADFSTKMDAKVTALKAEIEAASKKLEDLGKAGASKAELDAVNKELLGMLVTKEAYQNFEESIKAELAKKVDTEGLEEIKKEISDGLAGVKGRLAVLETVLKIKEGKSEAIKALEDKLKELGTKPGSDNTNLISELEKKVKANEAEILKLKESSSLKELQDLLKKLDVKVAGMSGALSSVVLYPESYINGVESVVLRPIFFGHNWRAPYAAADANGNVKVWGAVCPCKDCDVVAPKLPDCPEMYGKLMEGHTKHNKVFVANVYMMPTYVKYNVSPASIDKSMIDVDNLAVTSHLANFVKTRAGGVEDEGENPFTAKFVSLENGKMTVELDMNTDAFAKYYLPKMGENDLRRFFNFDLSNYGTSKGVNTPVLALQVPHAKSVLAKEENGTLEPYVTSDYVNVYVRPYVGLDIAKKQKEGVDEYNKQTLFSDYIEFDRKENKPNDAQLDECDQINAKDMPDGVNFYMPGSTTEKVPADNRVIRLVEGKTLDLVDYVQSIGKEDADNCSGEALDITKYGLEWRFDLLDGEGKTIKFIDKSNKTDQQEFIKLSDNKKGTISAKVVGQNASGAAVDRTPIVRVRIVDPKNPDCYISQAFIKVLIVKEEAAEMADVFVGTYNAQSPEGCSGLTRTLSWVEVNENIYNGTEHKGGDLNEVIKGLGMSKEEFVKIYGVQPKYEIDPLNPTHVGTLKWKLDESDAARRTGRTTYVPVWTVSLCELEGLCQNITYTDVVPVKSRFRILPQESYKDRYPAVIIDFAGNFSKPSFKATDKNLNIDYWNAAKTEVEHHSKSQSPAGNTNSATCTYSNNLNSIFRNPNPNYSLNLPGVAVNKYEYKFVADVKQQYVDAEENIEIFVEGNGKILKATKKDARGNVVGDEKQVIAQINDHNAKTATSTTEQGEDLLVYGDSELAKELLNKSWRNMWVRIQLLVKCEGCTPEVQLPVTINGKDNFVVYFLRPINAKAVSPKDFEDGNRFGLQGTILDIEKVVDLEDWHKEKFSKVPSFYGYYGIKSIKINKDEDIKWDSNGDIEKIPSTLKVNWIPRDVAEPNSKGTETGDAAGDGNYYTVKEINDALKARNQKEIISTTDKFTHGALTYFSNGTVVKGDFFLYVPIRIEYKWGEITTEIVKIKVKKTQVQEDKK